MSAGDSVPTYYFRAKVIIPDLPPLQVGPDLPPGSADAECKYENGNTYVRVREGYPSPLLTPEQQELERTNTFFHEFGHAYDKYLTSKVLDHHVKYFAFRKFPTTWDQAQKDADTMGAEGGWQWQPRESWAECFGAAMSGGWTKPEKTMDYGKPVDALAARAFFQSLGGVQPAPPPPPPVTHTIEWQGPVPTENYFVGRSGNPISLIVDHWMAATFDSALAHFMDPAAVVSAHYLISQQGRIVQVVNEDDTAYHAGSWPVNQLSIGIEHEASPTVTPSDALYAASAWLHHKLSLDYGLRLVVGETVKPHRAIVPTQCPGTLDLDRIVREAGGTDDMTSDEVIALIEAKYGLTNTITAIKAALDKEAHHKHDTPVVTTSEPK